jgi:hypothetical protein
MPPDAVSFAPGTQQHGRMQNFVATLLRHEGALVEAIEPDGLEVLAPPAVQRALGVGELSRLGFGATLPPQSQRVGIEGDWLERFATLLGPQGRFARRVLSPAAKAPGDPERVLDRDLVLDNATFRLLGVAPAWTRYLLLDFRVSAVSDDKRDFILHLGINLATGALLPDAMLAAMALALDDPATDISAERQAAPEGAEGKAAPEGAEGKAAPEGADLPAIWDRPRLLELMARALPPRLDPMLGPFLAGLRRRLGRDQERLHGYHNDLHREAMRRALALPEGDARRRREEDRAEAIGREYRAKLDDLSRQYATRVSVEWIQTLELTMPVHRFTVSIRRRKAERVVRLDWIVLLKRLEPPTCEFSASTERPRLVCDDAVHLVVPAALGPCPACARGFCRACHPNRCPKCGTTEPLRRGISGAMLS